MGNTVNVAVVGLGYWGPNLVRNFGLLENAVVTHACDQDVDRLEFIKKRYPAVRVSRDYREVIGSPHVDAVAIATPLSTHFAIARDALSKGKHVLVEKPMAASVKEANTLFDLAQTRKLVLMVDHTFVYAGAVEKMKEIIQRGELGELYYFDSVRINLGLFQKDINVVWDLAPHDFSILDYLINKKPLAITVSGACHVRKNQENIAYLTIYYEDDFIAHVNVSWLAPAKVRTIIVGGSEKMIVYDDMEGSEKVKIYEKGAELSPSPEATYKTLISYRTGDMLAPKLDEEEALTKVCADFVRCINTGAKSKSDGQAGLHVVRLLEAANQSLRLYGKKVDIGA